MPSTPPSEVSSVQLESSQVQLLSVASHLKRSGPEVSQITFWALSAVVVLFKALTPGVSCPSQLSKLLLQTTVVVPPSPPLLRSSEARLVPSVPCFTPLALYWMVE